MVAKRRLSVAFVDSGHCHMRVHCGTCRNQEAGRGWREALAKAFELPEGAPDFECPHGLPWGFEGTAQPITTEPTYEEVVAVCKECPERADCPFPHLKDCRQEASLKGVGMVCPAVPPRWGPVENCSPPCSAGM